MNRIYNFSAGPSCLPLPVLERAGREIACYGQAGMSVMEMSHRGKDFIPIAEAAEAKLRCLLGIPQNYKVLFLQGGASMQFAAVPLNLLPETGSADYIDSGNFAHLAMEEAQRFGHVRCAASSREENYVKIPEITGLDKNAAYLHITGNNTIYGTRYIEWPESDCLVCDLSSSILSEPIDVSKFGLIYAGAQKNMAPAGLTVVIVREDLLGRARPGCPAMLDYAVQAKAGSMYNTPPCWAIYMLLLVLEWLEGLGGLAAMKKLNQAKAAVLYDAIDQSKVFSSKVEKRFRSLMNVPFMLEDDEQNKRFIKEAAANGMVQLAGHRSVGGMRASIYNAMPREGVEKLAEFMKDFERTL
ncbi:MAG: 3-phosphoserine/phosphohydroxythreonine transaminase [Clostridia bacterium]|nr:3-phosphoserine/phosphohydroxythreonine transaminase [Clostridia bacterium]